MLPKTLASIAGLEEIAERGREQLADHQKPADTGSAPDTKEDLVESEFGGGQDTEPLRPSTTGNSACHPRTYTKSVWTGCDIVPLRMLWGAKSPVKAKELRP